MMHAHVFAFAGIVPCTLCSIDLNPFDEGGLFGSGDDEKAKKLSKSAVKQWENLQKQIPGAQINPNTGEVTYDQSLSYADNPLDSAAFGAADVQGFQAGPNMRAEHLAYADPGKSAYEGTRSAYAPLSSAYADFDPDATGREQQLDASSYYRSAMANPIDAIAEADYARRRGQAEQARRGQSEGAMRELEARGQGGGSEQLLAQLVNNNAAVGDQYQAGLDTAAQAQARRDNAAGQYASIGRGLYDQDASVAAQRAAGLDAAATQRAAGLDTYAGNKLSATDAWQKGVRDYGVDLSKYNADAATAANRYNHDRGNSVADANTALRNKVGEWNATGQQQQRFGNQMAVAGGQTGAAGNAAQIYQNAAVHPLQDVILPTVSNVAKATV